MKAYWANLTARIDKLKRRERVMVLAAAVVVVVALMNSLLLGPVMQSKHTAEGLILSNTAQTQELQQKIDAMNGVGKADPDAPKKAELAGLKTKLQAADDSLNHLRSTLVSPEKMPQLLESILQKNGDLKLVALRTLPVSSLLEDMKKSSEGNGRQADAVAVGSNLLIFRHGAEITVEGRYLDLLGYVTALEALSWNLLWEKVALVADESGVSRLTFTVYTLSLDKTWLSI